MYLVGLTGGIASGKSTVAKVFESEGVPVFDADLISRKVVEPGEPAWKELRECFGEEFFDENTGELQRAKLGRFVFANSTARRQLNRIVHPRVRKLLLKSVFRLACCGHPFVILDLPLLFETGTDKFMQKTIVVDCDEDAQLQRIIARDSLSETEAMDRIKAQMPIGEKVQRANFVIDNRGALGNTKLEAMTVLRTLQASRLHWVMRFGFTAIILCLVMMAIMLVV